MAQPAHTPDLPTFALLGRPLPLRAVTRLFLAGVAVMLVFGSGVLRDWMSYLPLWMDPVDLWLMDAAAAWHDWMTQIGATTAYDWVHQAVEELRLLRFGEPE